MRIDLEYLVQLQGPIHVGSGVGFARMVDDLMVRTSLPDRPEVEVPYIPGSTIKGRVRANSRRLADLLGLTVCNRGGQDRVCKQLPCIQCRLFGSTFFPGELNFQDSLLTLDWQTLALLPHSRRDDGLAPLALSSIRQGNQLERGTRTTQPDFLFSMEHTAEQLRFTGKITGSFTPAHPEGWTSLLPQECWMLISSLQMVDKIGGMKGRGLGRCKVQVSALRVDNTEWSTEDLDLFLYDQESLDDLRRYESDQTPS
ncbi:MAG: RAMP superfamily CRISPR-associated protein [Dehalococcoidia bacterium]